jgi:hypothetical protein
VRTGKFLDDRVRVRYYGNVCVRDGDDDNALRGAARMQTVSLSVGERGE